MEEHVGEYLPECPISGYPGRDHGKVVQSLSGCEGSKKITRHIHKDQHKSHVGVPIPEGTPQKGNNFHSVESTGFLTASQPWYSEQVRVLNDYWTQRAKREGYPARSVYKLQEMEERFHLLRGTKKILDLGAAPGSWSLYILRNVHPTPQIVAVDLSPLSIPSHENLISLHGDITDPGLLEMLLHYAPFDMILSDAAPSTTGIRTVDTARSQALVEAVLGFVPSLLKTGGSCVVKVFQGSDTIRIREDLGCIFKKTRSYKPKACRSESFELYFIGLEKREGLD